MTDTATPAITADTSATASLPTVAELLDLLRAELHDVNPEIPIDLPADGHLIEDLGVDSLDLIEFVARIEYDHDILVPDEDIDRLITLHAIADYMLGALRGG